MSAAIPESTLQLRSLVTDEGTVELSLVRTPLPAPAADEVVVRIEATPINPSDLGLLFGPADIDSAQQLGTADDPRIVVQIGPRFQAALAARLNQSLPVGNEAGGVVIAAGAAPEAQALLGKVVGISGGAMYTEYRVLPARECLAMHEGVTPAEAASCYVNPLTVLGMVETMRMEGHTALVHTAAASNLGQMLVKVCLQDGIDLVNIVRSDEQVALLKGLGAQYVCNSTASDFKETLTDMLTETGATIAFDATGGGKLGGYILAAMEVAANRRAGATEFSRYGSNVHKQLYIYGGLDTSPTQFSRNFGTSWGIGGWLLMPFLQKIGREAAERLRDRVAAEIRTTFASHYTREVSLAGALQLDALAVYARRATGQKYLITPHSGKTG